MACFYCTTGLAIVNLFRVETVQFKISSDEFANHSVRFKKVQPRFSCRFKRVFLISRNSENVNENWKVAVERGRHQVLAACLGDHVMQVLECCCELSSGTDMRCYEQLDASLPCMW